LLGMFSIGIAFIKKENMNADLFNIVKKQWQDIGVKITNHGN